MAHELGKPILPITWWLIHGMPRTGTSYMVRLITHCARRQISDWGLYSILKALTNHPYGRFDRRRALADFCFNLLENSTQGKGDQLELIFKQAWLRRDEFELLVQMWGRPTRKICCFREPAGTINSNIKKFPHHTMADISKRYLTQIKQYKRIGGELFEYHEHLTVDDYREFLRPLVLPDEVEPFINKGDHDKTHVTPPMDKVYERLRQLMTRQQQHSEKQ